MKLRTHHAPWRRVNRPMKILIVEDNTTVASALKHLLRHLGFDDVEGTDDGSDAVRMLSQEQYDLVIVDWTLPSLSGVGITQWMRKEETYRATPVIMVTARDQAEDVLIAIESGVNEYVLKPLDREVLRAKINKVVPNNSKAA